MVDRTFRLGGARSSLAFKAPCRVATTTNITLSGFQTIDGVTLADGDDNLRVLVKDQTNQAENGIYVAESGAWSRAADFDGNSDFVSGTRVYVNGGTVGAAVYVMTAADPIVIGTSSVTFATEASLLGAGVSFAFDGGGAPIAVGQQVRIEIPFRCTISGVRMFADQAGTIAVDLRKDSYANYPPTAGDSIVASAPPTITADDQSVDTTLTGWTTSISQGDVLLAIVTSTSGVIKELTVSLRVTRIA